MHVFQSSTSLFRQICCSAPFCVMFFRDAAVLVFQPEHPCRRSPQDKKIKIVHN